MKYLVTGGCGFLGTNLSAQVLDNDEDLIIFDDLSSSGSEDNLCWLKKRGALTFIYGDISDPCDIKQAIKQYRPDVIFHLAGQPAISSSFVNPRMDFEANTVGTVNILEALRCLSPNTTLIYSSTNKVYGDLNNIPTVEGEKRYSCPDYPEGFDETLPLYFHSPHSCSKGAAEQYVLDYTRNFGLNAMVFRHSTTFGLRQFASSEHGWIGMFCQQALETLADPERDPFSVCGNGKQVRDVLFVSDAVECYFSAAKKIDSIRGEVINIGGGMENSLSILELFGHLEELTGVKLRFETLPWRANDQKFYVSNNAKAYKLLNWKPKISSKEGIRKMYEWIALEHKEASEELAHS